MRVTLDTGATVRCTPDHLFRLRDGSYRRADQLAAGDSLMPLYRSWSAKATGDDLDGYEKIWMNDRAEWVYTHDVAGAFNSRHGIGGLGNAYNGDLAPLREAAELVNHSAVRIESWPRRPMSTT